jgi:hypothetical protein
MDGFSREGWGNLCQGGKNGFFIILLCLSWYAEFSSSVRNLQVSVTLDSLLDDVRWVLQKLVTNVEDSAGFKASNDNIMWGANKRAGEGSMVKLRVSPRKRCIPQPDKSDISV